MIPLLPIAENLAVISGVSTFLFIVIGVAVVSGVGTILFAPQPFKGLGIGLLAGTVLISVIIFTGPTK